VPTYIESVEALSSDHSPVILLMDLEPHETALQRMDSFTVNLACYYRHFLKQAIPGNPTITSIEEIGAAITMFVFKIKSTKHVSELYHTYSPQDSAIPDLEELLR
jgi:hypothetical protein